MAKKSNEGAEKFGAQSKEQKPEGIKKTNSATIRTGVFHSDKGPAEQAKQADAAFAAMDEQHERNLTKGTAKEKIDAVVAFAQRAGRVLRIFSDWTGVEYKDFRAAFLRLAGGGNADELQSFMLGNYSVDIDLLKRSADELGRLADKPHDIGANRIFQFATALLNYTAQSAGVPMREPPPPPRPAAVLTLPMLYDLATSPDAGAKDGAQQVQNKFFISDDNGKFRWTGEVQHLALLILLLWERDEIKFSTAYEGATIVCEAVSHYGTKILRHNSLQKAIEKGMKDDWNADIFPDFKANITDATNELTSILSSEQ